LKNEESLSVAYNTLANLYKAQGLMDKAFEYYTKSLKLIVKRKNKDQEALLLDNISMLWLEQKSVTGHLDSAAFYSSKAIDIARKANDVMLEMQLLPNAAGIAEQKKEFKEQLGVSLRGKNIADSMKIEGYQTYLNLNYASALINTGDPKKAVKIFKQSIKVLLEYKDYFGLASSYYEIARAYEAQNRNDSALFYFKLNKTYEDTLSIMRSKDKVNELLAKREIDLKESKIKNLKELNSALKEKENLSREKDRLKTIILYGAAVLLLIIVVLLVITFKRFRDNKKLSKEISLKNLALVTKNNEITDSINYAKRIQQALLPSKRELTVSFPESFILFRPKDIVSGDFYWIHTQGDLVFVAVGDCTGHGVPGGFMSMLGHSFLNQIVNEKHVQDPAQVLDQLREKVITSLRQTGAAGENKDGMDITFVRIDKKNNNLTYAAANNSFYFMQNGQITEHKADKQPIGYYSNVLRPFTQHTFDIQKGNAIYLFSDGYPDQFGGAKGKKLKHSTLQRLLIENAGTNMTTQAEALEKAFLMWRGTYEQTDDVCVVGIKL
jgi:serine phosphatase RsbU (regulator of sigma subunit)